MFFLWLFLGISLYIVGCVVTTRIIDSSGNSGEEGALTTIFLWPLVPLLWPIVTFFKGVARLTNAAIDHAVQKRLAHATRRAKVRVALERIPPSRGAEIARAWNSPPVNSKNPA